MGLDIYFIKQTAPVMLSPETGEQSPPLAEPECIGYYRKFNALLRWVNTRVKEVENCVDMSLSQAHLQALLHDLSRLTPENCSDVFPTESGFFFGSQDYDDDYWSEVDDLKAWVQQQLAVFDFEHDRMGFCAWW